MLETDAAHSVAGWATRMLDALESVKRNRLLCRDVYYRVPGIAEWEFPGTEIARAGIDTDSIRYIV